MKIEEIFAKRLKSARIWQAGLWICFAKKSVI